jgi:hypothetical protein
LNVTSPSLNTLHTLHTLRRFTTRHPSRVDRSAVINPGTRLEQARQLKKRERSVETGLVRLEMQPHPCAFPFRHLLLLPSSILRRLGCTCLFCSFIEQPSEDSGQNRSLLLPIPCRSLASVDEHTCVGICIPRRLSKISYRHRKPISRIQSTGRPLRLVSHMASDGAVNGHAPSGATDAALKASDPVPEGAVPVHGLDFDHFADRDITVAELVDNVGNMGFQASSIGQAVKIINGMVGTDVPFSPSYSIHRTEFLLFSGRGELLKQTKRQPYFLGILQTSSPQVYEKL